jgi:hypothetical protein
MGRQLGLLRLAVSSARATDWNLRPPPSVVLLGGPMRPHAGAAFLTLARSKQATNGGERSDAF